MSADRTFIASMMAPGERPSTYLAQGRGVRLTLADGRTVIDGGSLSSCIVGHCHPRVVEAVQAAANTVYIGHGEGWSGREEAAADLLRYAFAGEDWPESVALFVSSSEAADLGLLLAQTLSGRSTLVARERGFHGGVGLARALSGHPLWGGQLAPVHDAAIQVHPAPHGVPVRWLPVPQCGLGATPPGHDCSTSCLASAPEILDGAAAVMMDYTQGALCPSPQYQDTLAGLAGEAGVYWIADETVTAFGRLGHGFAFQRGRTRPDMVTLGKGITGAAAPGGALVLSRDVVDEIGERRWMTASTFRGHPVTVAAISATMRVLHDEGLVARAAELGPRLGREIHELATRHPSVLRVVGEGLMWQLYLDVPAAREEGTWTGTGDSESLPEIVHREALDRGAFVGIFSGQCVWVIPPLIIEQEDLTHVLEALDGALSVADRTLLGGP